MFKRAILMVLLWSAALPVFGFALLGPYTDWMTWSNGYRPDSQRGGPMNIGDEYRWNLPVITYGFDPEFVEYFGEEGITAMESAIAMLTNLPPASEMVLEDYGLQTRRFNATASELGLLDFRGFSLHWLLSQLGLAQPTPSTWTVRERSGDSVTVMLRNFDPASLMPTNVVNGAAYNYWIYTFADGGVNALEVLADELGFLRPSAADGELQAGLFWFALTRDDIGGLRYLYSRENVNVEPLPADVTMVDSSNRPSPDVAPRPGIEKVNFLRMTWDTHAHRFNSVTSVFDLAYVTNGTTSTQRVQRIVSTPDILFEVRDLGGKRGRATTGEYYFRPEVLRQTDVNGWQNCSSLNNSNGAGPGIITPGGRVTFNKLGKYRHLEPYPGYVWGSFDDSPEAPVAFLGNERLETVTLDHYIQREGTNSYFNAVLLGTVGAVYQIDTSNNLTVWTPLTTITNNNIYDGYFSFRDEVTAPKKFYRAVRRE
jgi:hypothetical protein